jgi:flagellar basal-body rod protein FlgF
VDHLIYTSLTAMRGAMARQTATANNLANVQTPGFRAEISEAESLWLTGVGQSARAFGSTEVVAADMRAGTIVPTGRALDIAVSGDAMFAVQTEEGEEAYTRRGDLQISDSGLLTTGDGHPVFGKDGPITVPPYDSISVDADGGINIVPRGGDPATPQKVDTLKLGTPAGLILAKGLDGLFRLKGGGILPETADARVTAGSLEGSNVSATQALVDMIEASRSWENQLKLLSDARDMDMSTTELMRISE